MFATTFIVASLLRLAASLAVTPPEQQAVSASPAQPAQTDLMLDVTVHAYNEAGYHSASAGNRGLEPFESYAWLTETCEMGSSGRPPATAPRSSYIWHFTGKILERSGQDFDVQVDWDRSEIGAAGSTPVVAQKSSFRSRMHDGDRVVLDALNPAVVPTCSIRSARLEVAIAPGRVATGASGGARSGRGASNVGGIGVGGRGVGGRGVGGGGVGGVGASGAGGGLSRGAYVGTTTGGVFVAPAPDPSNATPANAPFEAEVWLVHTWPTGLENLRQTVAFGSDGWSFSFAPVRAITTRGLVTVSVSGVLRLELANGQPNAVQVDLNRHVQSNGPPALDTFGGSAKRLPMPAPTEVISFELPSLTQPAQDLLAGHQFSLRIRLGPKK